MRMRRPATVLALGLIAGVALTGCRTSPNVAAYIGDETITVDELQDAVAAHRADPAVTPGEDPDYTRTILTDLVRAELVTSAAEHFGVSPDPGGLTDLLELLLNGEDPETFYQQAAAQGLTRADALDRVRQVAVLQAIAVEEGAVDATTEASLRAIYQERLAQQPAQLSVGYINVVDQATADSLVATLQADPGSYSEVAAPFLDSATLPAPQTVTIDGLISELQLPADLAARVADTPPGTVFSTPVEGLDGVLVVFVGEAPVPAFEDVRPQVESAAIQQAAAAGAGIVTEYQDQLGIDVNPRYGAIEGDLLDQGVIAPAEGGVVRLLDTED